MCRKEESFIFFVFEILGDGICGSFFEVFGFSFIGMCLVRSFFCFGNNLFIVVLGLVFLMERVLRIVFVFVCGN